MQQLQQGQQQQRLQSHFVLAQLHDDESHEIAVRDDDAGHVFCLEVRRGPHARIMPTTAMRCDRATMIWLIVKDVIVRQSLRG